MIGTESVGHVRHRDGPGGARGASGRRRQEVSTRADRRRRGQGARDADRVEGRGQRVLAACAQRKPLARRPKTPWGDRVDERATRRQTSLRALGPRRGRRPRPCGRRGVGRRTRPSYSSVLFFYKRGRGSRRAVVHICQTDEHGTRRRGWLFWCDHAHASTRRRSRASCQRSPATARGTSPARTPCCPSSSASRSRNTRRRGIHLTTASPGCCRR